MHRARLLRSSLALVVVWLAGCAAPDSSSGAAVDPDPESTRAAQGADHVPPFGYHDLWDYSLLPAPGRWLTAPEIAQLAKLSAEAGATVNRISIGWAAIEANPPCVQSDGSIEHHYDDGAWAHAASVMAAHAAVGIRSLLLINGAPAWAADPNWKPAACGSPPPAANAPACPEGVPCSFGVALAHASDFGPFIAAVIQHYPNVVGLELFNEPNSSRFWAPAPDPEAFAAALHAAFDGRATTGSKVPLVLGGLAMGSPIRAPHFLDLVYQHGVEKWIDGIGLHPYPARAPWVEVMWDRIHEILAVRDARDHEGDKPPVWITEVGVGGSDVLAGNTPGVVRANREGEVLLDLYRSTKGKSSIAVFIAYSFRDWPTEAGRHAVEGILSDDLQRKPAYCYVARAFHQKAELCGADLPRCDLMGGTLCEHDGNGLCGGIGPRAYGCDHCCGGSL